MQNWLNACQSLYAVVVAEHLTKSSTSCGLVQAICLPCLFGSLHLIGDGDQSEWWGRQTTPQGLWSAAKLLPVIHLRWLPEFEADGGHKPVVDFLPSSHDPAVHRFCICKKTLLVCSHERLRIEWMQGKKFGLMRSFGCYSENLTACIRCDLSISAWFFRLV